MQPRSLVVTNQAVYNCDVSCTKLKRRIALLRLGSITVNDPTGSIALHMPSEDYLFVVRQMGHAVERAAAAGEGDVSGGPPKQSLQKGTARRSPCSALGDALQSAYQVLHKSSGESLVVRTFNGTGLLKDTLQRKQKRSSGDPTDDLTDDDDLPLSLTYNYSSEHKSSEDEDAKGEEERLSLTSQLVSGNL